jgi:hypothetical protein
MGKVFIQGLALAIAGVVAIALNQLLDLGLGSIGFGLLIGGVLGLVSDGGPVGRIGGFVVGIIVALVMYIVRVLLLNESFAGQVTAMVITLAVLTVVSALTLNRIPLWSGLLGTALVVGAYETSFIANPANVTSELIQYTTMALLPAAIGYLGVVFVAHRSSSADGADEAQDSTDQQQPTAAAANTNEG